MHFPGSSRTILSVFLASANTEGMLGTSHFWLYLRNTGDESLFLPDVTYNEFAQL